MRTNFIKRRLRMRETYVLPNQKRRQDSAIKIQRWIKYKLWKYRKRKMLSEYIVMIQKVYRGHLGRIAAEKERRELQQIAALIIQEQFRKYILERDKKREENKESCPVCLEDIGIFNSITLTCKHKICMGCLRELISHSISNAQTDIPIKCPLSSDGCEKIISCCDDGMFALCSDENYRKWEYWEIMKSHIPKEYIAYCPYPECGMPYDSSEFPDLSNNTEDTSEDPFKYRILCPECTSLFCVRCKMIWQPGHRCRTAIQQISGNTDDDKTSRYIEQHCKMCPNCNAVVEKSQTENQATHERLTGLSGGTEDCHHMTCTNCKKDFCWTCLEMYTGMTYYHSGCPISDVEISFTNTVPRFVRLPISINEIKITIVDASNHNIIKETEWYNTNGTKLTIHSSDLCPTQRSVFMDCTEDGYVISLKGLKGNFTYRQDNKRGTTSRDIHQVYQNSTLMQVNNRIRNLGMNQNLHPVFANNRIHNNGPLGNENIVLPRRNDPLPPPVPPRLPQPPILNTDGEVEPTQIRGRTETRMTSPTRRRRDGIPLLPGVRTVPHSATDLLNRFNRR